MFGSAGKDCGRARFSNLLVVYLLSLNCCELSLLVMGEICVQLTNLENLDLDELDDDVQEAKDWCLIGRCFSTRSVLVEAMMVLLNKLWKCIEEIMVRVEGKYTFIFEFYDPHDGCSVLN